MKFFDCNVWYGLENNTRETGFAADIDALCSSIEVAGINKAVVWNTVQRKSGPVAGNRQLAQDISDKENLYGVWSIIPTHTHEIPDPDKMPEEMKKNNIIGFRLFPENSRFMPRPFALYDWFEMAQKRKIPVFINTSHGTTLDDTVSILKEFPQLVIVLTYQETWPSDRILRPITASFENVYIDLTCYITEGGIASFVKEYGAGRLLFGSGYPESYFGANMLMLKHADISDQDKSDIAAGNLERIIEAGGYIK